MSGQRLNLDARAAADYLLLLADNALILSQRNAEWCGHGPILEEDIAMANISLDLVGQARLLYQRAAALRNDGSTEDSLAYFRNEPDFCNLTLVELPHQTALAGTARGDRDYAVTIARNFLYSAFMALLWERLQQSTDETLAAIAVKSLKETRYHLRHSRDWLVRLGDGTAESAQRMQAALDHLMPYTQEFWALHPAEAAAAEAGLGADPRQLQADWETLVADGVAEAQLQLPPASGFVPTGKRGVHSEHMGFLLAEMQSVARAHPGAQW